MLNRRNFIQKTLIGGIGFSLSPMLMSARPADEIIMTVNGPISPAAMKLTLTHEHILADFIGAKEYSHDRYHADEVYARALPYVEDVKKRGCSTFIDCSPAYLGRDVQILKRLSVATGLNFVTNTGYYGAVGEKFLPPQAYTETAQQIADRWTVEWKDGIEGTGIKPGFIKTSVDKFPLTPTQAKIIEAAALTHKATGLAIAIHTGDGEAAREQIRILAKQGVSPSARIWVHAQNEKDKTYHIEAARKKSWVSFDGINPETIDINIRYLQNMQTEGLLDQVLISQDSGWYHVGEPNGGDYKDYNTIFTRFIPAMKENGFTQKEIDQLLITNPPRAFSVKL